MARRREFDEEDVLERAMTAFWRRGYRATSLDELLAAMRISKSSFYAAFGTKRDVLLTAMKRYAESGMGGLVEPLLRPGAARGEIEETLRRLARHACSSEGQRGCLVNNCLGEVAAHEPEVLRATREILASLEKLITAAVERGQAAGEIARDESPRAIARFLASTFAALNLAAKAKPRRRELDDVVRMTLRVLGPVPKRRNA